MLQQTADMALNTQSRSSSSSLLPTTSGFETCWDAMLDRDVTCSAHGPREAEAVQWYNWASGDWSRSLVCLSSDCRRGEICHRRRVQRVRTPSGRAYCTYEHTMANHSDLNYVDRGQRGELVKALLTMQACDAAGATSRNRWVSVDSFMKELLPPSQYDSLHGSYPGFWYVDEKASFNEAFLNYGIWFDHTIKVKKGKYSQPSASGSLSCTGRWCCTQIMMAASTL